MGLKLRVVGYSLAHYALPGGEFKLFFIMLFMIWKQGILDMFLILYAFIPVGFIAPEHSKALVKKDIPLVCVCFPESLKPKNHNNRD